MPSLDAALETIARQRARDPLAPVTVVAPSHVAALQLRRRLADYGAFAGVRFETLPRLAELVGAGRLAQTGRTPLARPIGDYVAKQVAAESLGELRGADALGGYARVLRQTFRRLRRGGFTDANVPVELGTGNLGEAVRLFGRFRAETARFYDDDDLLDVAADALAGDRAAFATELGGVWLLPPGPLSAAAHRFVEALRRVAGAGAFHDVDEEAAPAEQRFVLAPDPASEARAAVREVIVALEDGIGLHEIAVFHAADRAYRQLLAQAFEAADIPAAVMPGRPLVETACGRAVLALAELPSLDYARAAVLDFLLLSPLRPTLPAADGTVSVAPSAWQRLAREAGVTHGAVRWHNGLETLARDRQAALDANEALSEGRRAAYTTDLTRAADLQAFIETLIGRLEPLRRPQPAAAFVRAFGAVVRDYLRPDAEALTEVEQEIEQLGTIDAVGGSFGLAAFAEALRANLTTATKRERGLGQGVLVADYRLAAGLRFRRVVLCGAYEGVFPPAPEAETLIDDTVWQRLRERHPFVEDARLHQERALAAAERAATAAGEAVWLAPLRDGKGTAERYPASLMVAAARQRDAVIETATTLRGAPARDWLQRSASPLAALLAGPIVDLTELRLRNAVDDCQSDRRLAPEHALTPSLRLLRARRGARLSEYDGNVGGANAGERLPLAATIAPTSLEAYATCGFRYFLASVLHLRPVEDPEERDTIDAAERGSVVHRTLQAFYGAQLARGRPRPGEAWDEADLEELLRLLDAELTATRQRGRGGLDVYADFDRRSLRADLAAFLESDSEFRILTGAVPAAFEQRIPAATVAGLTLTGFVDRVDLTPDGKRAWVIDYKTGSTYGFSDSDGDDIFAGGRKLQLPVYVGAAAGAEVVKALYWFISRRGDFRQIAYEATPAREARFVATLTAIRDGLERGAFPAVSGDQNEFYGGFDNCRFCDFDRICARRRDADFAAKAEDAPVGLWLGVGRAARGETPS